MGGTCSFIFHYGEKDRAGGLFSHCPVLPPSSHCPVLPATSGPPPTPNPHPTRGTPGSPPARRKSPSSRSPGYHQLSSLSLLIRKWGRQCPPQVVRRNSSAACSWHGEGAVQHSWLELVWPPLLCRPLNHLLLEASRLGEAGGAGFRASPPAGLCPTLPSRH